MSENNCRNQETSCCCSSVDNCSTDELVTPYDKKAAWVTGEIRTEKGLVPLVSTQLVFSDICGTWKARWGFGRMDYKINPGLYAVGKPDGTAPVLVSANYKLTFDKLRKELAGLDCWLLILDTEGINVWCAAGKGTFSTEELIRRIAAVQLTGIVSHKKLILPQLGASGVSSHEIKRQTGFEVIYGPVRARDIKAFIAAGCHATRQMRMVKFSMGDRLALTPIEVMEVLKISLLVFGVMFLINLFAARPFDLEDFLVYAAAALIGTVLTPMLLPFIPGRAFSWKGWLLGLLGTAGLLCGFGWFTAQYRLLAVGYMLAMPAYSAFLAMNFTGSSTFTSFSGVIKEMKVAVPLIAISFAVGVILILIKTFTG